MNNAGCNIGNLRLKSVGGLEHDPRHQPAWSTFFVAQTIARGMSSAVGRIINISSVDAVSLAYAGLAPYGAAAAESRQLTMSLADDWGKHGTHRELRSAPGWFETDQNKAMYQNEGWLEYLKERIPVRPDGPTIRNGAIVFLASEGLWSFIGTDAAGGWRNHGGPRHAP